VELPSDHWPAPSKWPSVTGQKALGGASGPPLARLSVSARFGSRLSLRGLQFWRRWASQLVQARAHLPSGLSRVCNLRMLISCIAADASGPVPWFCVIVESPALWRQPATAPPQHHPGRPADATLAESLNSCGPTTYYMYSMSETDP
jgi:hypothetical protein